MKKLVVAGKGVKSYVIPLEKREPFLVYVEDSTGFISLAEADAMGGVPFQDDFKQAARYALDILEGTSSLKELEGFSSHYPLNFRDDANYVCRSEFLGKPRGLEIFKRNPNKAGKAFYNEFLRLLAISKDTPPWKRGY